MTPIADPVKDKGNDQVIDQVTLPGGQHNGALGRKKRGTAPIPTQGAEIETHSGTGQKGLLHRLPFFGKRK
jgi:hypothetical protein